tara:strand:- start:16 stop:561 length:546 start_codon:yes stop_codon:yes gene_type:complete
MVESTMLEFLIFFIDKVYMKSYICNFCSYETTDPSNWRKHNMSKKHLKKEQQSKDKQKDVSSIIHTVATLYPTKEEIKSYTCDYCNFSTSHRPNLYKHQNRCSNRKHEQEKEKMEKEMLIKENDSLRRINDILRDSLINGGNNVSTNGNAITEALYKKMKDNPPLGELDCDDFFDKHIHRI